MQEINGKGCIDPTLQLVVTDQEVEFGIDDIRNMRITMPVDALENSVRTALDHATDDVEQKIIQIDIPLTMTITITKK